MYSAIRTWCVFGGGGELFFAPDSTVLKMDRRRRRGGHKLLVPSVCKSGVCRVRLCKRYCKTLKDLERHILVNHRMTRAQHSALPPADPNRIEIPRSTRARKQEACGIPDCARYGDRTTHLKRHVTEVHKINMNVYHDYMDFLRKREERRLEWPSVLQEIGSVVEFRNAMCEVADAEGDCDTSLERSEEKVLDIDPDYVLSGLLEVCLNPPPTLTTNAASSRCRFNVTDTPPGQKPRTFSIILKSSDCTIIRAHKNRSVNSSLIVDHELEIRIWLRYSLKSEDLNDFCRMVGTQEHTMMTFGPQQRRCNPDYFDFDDEKRYGMYARPDYITVQCTECGFHHNVPAECWSYRWLSRPYRHSDNTNGQA